MVRVRELSESEARRLQRIVSRGAKNIVTWRRATVVLASAQGQKVSVIAKLVQTSEDRVREMIHNFNEAGMDSLFPKWSEGRPATFTPKVRARIRIARARPAKFGLPFTTWSLDKLRDYLVERRVVKTTSKERLRQILAEEGITFQKTKSWKESPGPQKEDKLARIEEAMETCPDRVFAFDELGPLNLVPQACAGPTGKGPSAFRRTTTSSRACGSSSPAITSGRTSCGVTWRRRRRVAVRPCGRSRASENAYTSENGST